jgi:hypothetical protein
VSAFGHLHVNGSPVVTARCDDGTAYVSFDDDNTSRVTLSDTPGALVATLTEAIEAVDRAWRASRGDQ